MALHPEFPRSPYEPLLPERRWFPAPEELRNTAALASSFLEYQRDDEGMQNASVLEASRCRVVTLVIKNLPEELHARLKEQARPHHRSVTKEVVNLIEAGLQAEEEKPPLPAPIRLKSGYRPTVEDIENAIAEGQD